MSHREFKLAIFFLSTAALLVLFYKVGTSYQRLVETPVDFWVQDQTADCALVLTGGSQRVREGIDLLARQQIRKLIISGVNPMANFNEIFPIHPFHSMVREEDIVLERKSLTTFGNVQQSVPIVEALKCRDLMLITSNIHMFRALQTLRAELPIQVNIIPRSVWTSRESPSVWDAALETVKVLFYSLWAFS